MARRGFEKPRKRRTREHVLADLSANYVEKIALGCAYAVDRISKDYGLDLAIFTFDQQGFLESGVLWFQLKASDRVRRNSDGTAIVVNVDRRDILAWIADAYPVVLTMYDAQRDCAYWLLIQRYFAGPLSFSKLSGKTVAIPIPVANVLTTTAMQDFARLKVAV